jgi:hypothetical protein
MASSFAALPTSSMSSSRADQNLQFQQNLESLPISVIVLAAETSRLDELRPLVPELLKRLAALEPRTFIRIGG